MRNQQPRSGGKKRLGWLDCGCVRVPLGRPLVCRCPAPHGDRRISSFSSNKRNVDLQQNGYPLPKPFGPRMRTCVQYTSRSRNARKSRPICKSHSQFASPSGWMVHNKCNWNSVDHINSSSNKLLKWRSSSKARLCVRWRSSPSRELLPECRQSLPLHMRWDL